MSKGKLLGYVLCLGWLFCAEAFAEPKQPPVSAPLAPPNSEVSADEMAQRIEQYRQNKAQIQRLQNNQHSAEYLNALIYQHSPYLLRHATNPIAWRPWSEAVFAQAKEQQRLIFLSIGYSTCHWCHEMERQSFVDVDLAKLLNRDFIAVKVDRETLPAVDSLYSAILENLKGSAGWPVSAVLNEKGEPLFIDSYLSKDKLTLVLNRMSGLWRDNRDLMNSHAQRLMSLIDKSQSTTTDNWQKDSLETIIAKLKPQLDSDQGGFVGAPKFPAEGMVLFLLDYLKRAPDPALESALRRQLDSMIAKGMFDSIYGGFHRYSTDANWQLPHYEKMLYNQGQLLLVYAAGYERFAEPRYLDAITRTFEFLQSTLYQPDEGLYSAVDAVYQGLDGGYYLWSDTQLAAFSKQQKRDAAMAAFVRNESLGLSGIYFNQPLSDSAEQIRTKLRSLARPLPMVDSKVITAWNALAAWGLIEGYRVTANQQMLQMAREILAQLYRQHFERTPGRLYRASIHHQRLGEGTLEDHAYLAKALLALYRQSGEPRDLEQAKTLVALAISRFADKQGGFRFSQQAVGSRQLPYSGADGELLSAAAVMVSAMNDLWLIQGQDSARKAVKQQVNWLKQQVLNSPLNHLYALKVILDFSQGSVEPRQYFAKGKGQVSLSAPSQLCAEQPFSLDFKLAPGWHVNSAQPKQKYLKPFALKQQGATKSLTIDYPKAKLKALSFNATEVSLYEGAFSVGVNPGPGEQGPLYLSVEVQPCSDKVCLLPQTLNFFVAGCR